MNQETPVNCWIGIWMGVLIDQKKAPMNLTFFAASSRFHLPEQVTMEESISLKDIGRVWIKTHDFTSKLLVVWDACLPIYMVS